jgi:hypothetical protein
MLIDAAKVLGVEAKLLKAVCEVESSGEAFMGSPARTPRGLDVSGKPIVQFEGHCFWKELAALKDPKLAPKALLKDPATKAIVDATGQAIGPLLPSILYQKWTKKYMFKPIAEWDQLTAARAIHPESANRATSWGAFQIMGFNYEYCRCSSGTELSVKAETLAGQLATLVDFLKNYSPAMFKALKNKDFETFARLYNGGGYKANAYDAKLATRYKFADI